jgi:lactose/L-arabinose transport system ATP-binding protein
MATLVLQKVEKRFESVPVIRPMDLAVEHGEFVVFVGPSGCGKSTLLRMIAGLEPVSSGEIHVDGRNVTNLPPVERNVAMVFQNYALYPHMTVEENIGFGLRIAGMPKAQRREKVTEAARILKLEPYLARKPKALSGGQRQRVAIGRAIVKNPKLFLFDEPLSNLDAELRFQTRLEIAKLHQDLDATMIYVTHDQVEAMTLADRIVVLRDGCIEQVGAPMQIYLDPANVFVAGFVGSPKMNFLDARISAVSAHTVWVTIPTLASGDFECRTLRSRPVVGTQVTIGVRSEHIEDAGGDLGFSARVSLVERLGSVSYAYVETALGARLSVERRAQRPDHIGDTFRLRLLPECVFAFAESGERL